MANNYACNYTCNYTWAYAWVVHLVQTGGGLLLIQGINIEGENTALTQLLEY